AGVSRRRGAGARPGAAFRWLGWAAAAVAAPAPSALLAPPAVEFRRAIEVPFARPPTTVGQSGKRIRGIPTTLSSSLQDLQHMRFCTSLRHKAYRNLQTYSNLRANG